jgi:hypothetical protein
MTRIEIPFSDEMAMAALEYRKIATTRSEKKGNPGVWFEIKFPEPYLDEPGTFRIIDVLAVAISEVQLKYYRLEGFDSPEEFEITWRKLHRGHFTRGKEYYIHFFTRVE